MTAAHLIAALKQRGTDGLPDVHRLAEDRLKIFWALHAASDRAGAEQLSVHQISKILSDYCSISIPWQRVGAILDKERGSIERRRYRGSRRFKLMKAGLDLLLSQSADVIFIDPSKGLSHIRKTEELLTSLRGELRVCDPYVNNRTLDFLACCSAATAIRLLTVNIYRSSQFGRDLKAFEREYGPMIDVRVASKPDLHDRYIIHEQGMLHFGASLNGLGAKQSIVTPLGHDIRAAAIAAFDRAWSTAKAFVS